MAAGRPAFQCQQDRLPAVPPEAYANGLPQQTPIEPIANPAPDGALFRARLAIDSDWEFRQRFASSAAATSYIGNLVGYASTIYTDQLDTQLEVSFSRVFDSSADPYTQTASDCALYEFGKHWNDNFAGTSRTIAHLVSGKGSGGGVAWVGVLCNGAFNVDTTGAGCPAGGPTGTANYGGAYGFTGEMTGSFNPAAPSPTRSATTSTRRIRIVMAASAATAARSTAVSARNPVPVVRPRRTRCPAPPAKAPARS
jgi:hypothetical protein